MNKISLTCATLVALVVLAGCQTKDESDFQACMKAGGTHYVATDSGWTCTK